MWGWLAVFVFILLITLALLWYPKSVLGGVEMPKNEIPPKTGSGEISFVPITKDNEKAVRALRVAKQQKGKVAMNAGSINLGRAKQTYNGKPIEYVLRAITYNGEPVGLILLRYNVKPYKFEMTEEGWQPGAFLNRLMVAGNMQGKGLGRAAIEFATQETRRRGYNRLYTSYHKGKHGPKQFYEKMGFKHTGQEIWKEHVIYLDV